MELIRFASRLPVSRRLVKGPTYSIVNVASGHSHFILMDNSASLWGIGSNFYGQLGLKQGINLKQMFGSYQEDEDWFVNATPLEWFSNAKVIGIATGNFHSSALTSDGNVFNWGANYLGNGALEATCQPEILVIPQAKDENFVQIASSGNSSVVINKNGAMFIWGCFPGKVQAKEGFFQEANGCFSFPVQLPIDAVFDNVLMNDCFLYLVKQQENSITIWNVEAYKSFLSGYPSAFPIPLHLLKATEKLPEIKFEKIQFDIAGLNFTKILPVYQRAFAFVALEEDGRIFCIFKEKLVQLDGRFRDFAMFYHNILLFDRESNNIYQLKIVGEREMRLITIVEASDSSHDSIALGHEQLLVFTKGN